jgi:hypothetical protein
MTDTVSFSFHAGGRILKAGGRIRGSARGECNLAARGARDLAARGERDLAARGERRARRARPRRAGKARPRRAGRARPRRAWRVPRGAIFHSLMLNGPCFSRSILRDFFRKSTGGVLTSLTSSCVGEATLHSHVKKGTTRHCCTKEHHISEINRQKTYGLQQISNEFNFVTRIQQTFDHLSAAHDVECTSFPERSRR